MSKKSNNVVCMGGNSSIMRKEFSEWILNSENLMPAEIRYFIKCIRMEIERQRESMTEHERNCSENCEFSLVHFERELERAWNKSVLKLTEKVYESKLVRARELGEGI